MLNCLSSESNLANPLAATIDDIVELASSGTDDFDEYLRAAEVRQPWEPLLVFLVLPGGEVVVIDDGGVPAVHDVAERVARHLGNLAPGGACRFDLDGKDDPRTVIAVTLPVGEDGISLACVVRPARSPAQATIPRSSDESILLGALSWLGVKYKAEIVKLIARTEQLGAGNETLQESYSRSLTKAVEEREERLREQQEHTSRLQAIMMTAADGIVTIDANGSIESLNAAAAEIFGYAPEETIGSHVSILFPQDDETANGAFYECLSQCSGCGHRVLAQELLGRRKDGTAFPLELAISDVALANRVVITAISGIWKRKPFEPIRGQDKNSSPIFLAWRKWPRSSAIRKNSMTAAAFLQTSDRATTSPWEVES